MKKFNSRNWFSLVGLLLVLSSLLCFASPLLSPHADVSGGSSSGSGGGSSAGSAGTVGSFASIGTMGYRVYFAPKALHVENKNPYFDGDTYSKLGRWQDIAVYELYNWEGGSVANGLPVYGLSNGTISNSKVLRGSISNATQLNGSLSAVNLAQPIGGSNGFGNLVNLANDTLNQGKYGISMIFENYKAYVASYGSELDTNQNSQLEELKSKDVEEVMLVFEPVFICQSGSKPWAYTISYCDWGSSSWGGGVSEWSGASWVASRINNKLNQFWTEFTKDGIEYNPAGSGRWEGFSAYTQAMTGKVGTKFGVGFNVALQYTGEVKKNLVTGEDIALSLSETELAPSNYGHNDSIGDPMYMEALSDWDALEEGYSASDYTTSKLYMAGWGFNREMYSQIPWEGVDISNVNLLKQVVPDDMKDKIAHSATDYVLGVMGNMNYDAVQMISDNDLYITNNTVYKIDLVSGTQAKYESAYGTPQSMQMAESYIKQNVRAVLREYPAQNDEGLSFGSRFRVSCAFAGNSADVVGQTVSSAVNYTLPVAGVTEVANLDADCDNLVTPRMQVDAQDVKEKLSRIKGATAYAHPIYTEGEDNVDLFKIGDDSAITVSVTTLSSKVPVTSVLGSVKLSSNDNGYELGQAGSVYKNTRLAQGVTRFYVNGESFSTVGSAETSRTYVITWKNSDMADKPEFDYLASTDLTSKTTALGRAIASKLGSEDLETDDASGLARAFRQATGVNPYGVCYVGDGSNMNSSVQLGSTFDGDELSGISGILVTVDGNTVVNSIAEAGLPAYRLNMIVPSALGLKSNRGGLTSLNWRYAKVEVSDSLSGDLINYGGTDFLYYNSSKGRFGSPNEPDKTWYNPSFKIVPSYAYNLSRGMWGDYVTCSNFRGTTADGTGNSTYRGYISNDLGFPVGTVPQNSPAFEGDNVEGCVGDTKRDTFTYYADAYRWSRRRGYRLVKSTTIRYNITHQMNKFMAKNLPTADVGEGVANSLYQYNADIGRDTAFTYYSTMTDQSKDTLYLYPEVNMIMQYPTGSVNVTEVNDVYVLGEKQRSFHPVSLRGIVVEDGAFSGQFSSNTSAVGKNAKNLSRASGNLPVIYTGGNINLHVDGINDKFKLLSYSLDLRDNADNGVSIRNAFSSENSNYKPEEEHKAYVNDTLNKLGVDVTLDISSDKEGNSSIKKYHNFNTMVSNFDVSHETPTSFNITFKHGSIDRSEQGWKNFISDLANEYGVSESVAETELFEGSEIEAQLMRALQSSNESNNGSSSTRLIQGNHWYDEQCTVLTIKKYKTYVGVGDVALSDKLDIDLGNAEGVLQQLEDRNSLFAKTLGNGGGVDSVRRAFGKWYITLYLKDNIEFENGESCTGSKSQILWQEKYVNGSDFVVSDATTNDMRN